MDASQVIRFVKTAKAIAFARGPVFSASLRFSANVAGLMQLRRLIYDGPDAFPANAPLDALFLHGRAVILNPNQRELIRAEYTPPYFFLTRLSGPPTPASSLSSTAASLIYLPSPDPQPACA